MMKVVFSSSGGKIGIWWYPEKALRKENIKIVDVASTI